ncbi:MAG: VWA domain-containing protein [Gammaproteobacteria bacterium]|nr:VWA domain-containing protein [Gammaproteobacteria bacterium]
MRKRRGVEEVSLSFLDCICCGFGAIILLLVITKTTEPVVLEQTAIELNGVIDDLQEQLFDIRGDTAIINRELLDRREQLSQYRQRLARLQAELSSVRGRFATTEQEAMVADIIAGKLATAKQELSEEMRRLLGADFRRKPDDSVIGGVPVDSEYVIFVIDTSGSMFNYAWDMVMLKLEETLAIYPDLKGIQIMNDQGGYMFSQYRGKWIPDTEARREAIVERMKTWNPFSNSSPVEGITAAVQEFWAPDKRISIYVFGDDFTGASIDEVIETVDKLNRVDEQGNRRVRIHAVGFPVLFANRNAGRGGERFANLMRILCERNGGTFVGLQDFQ